MAENKLDRGNLRRQAQRVESYRTLISRTRTRRSPATLRKLSFDRAARPDIARDIETLFPARDIEDEHQIGKGLSMSSPGSSTPSSSSDSSQDYRLNLCSSLKAIQSVSYQSERETSSVMTRSATKKYASVGSIHNRVDIDKEMRVTKQWPTNVSYPIPVPPDDLTRLRDVLSRSFAEVLGFCRAAVTPEKNHTQTVKANDFWKPQETEKFIYLSPYLMQEPLVDSENEESQITLRLNEDYVGHPFFNVIALHEEQEGTFLLHGEGEEYETITLHSGDKYLVENKYFSTNDSTGSFYERDTFPGDAMKAINNDHTYAAKPNENLVVRDVEVPPKPPSPKEEDQEREIVFENALNDLLLNTAILKCLICNETPQEIMSQLDMAQSILFSGDGLL